MKKFFIFLAALLPVAAIAVAESAEGGDETVQEPTTISIGKNTLRVLVNSTDTLTATITPDASQTLPVEWSSSNEAVATVSGEGVVKALGIGTTTIQAVCDGDTATRNVTVGFNTSNATPSVNIAIGATQTPYVALAEGVEGNVAWTSSAENVATVDENGAVKVLGFGATVTITATRTFADETTASAKFSVKGVFPEEDQAATLLVGGTVQLPGTIDGTTTWTSSSADVATVENGLVTAVGLGTATITAKGGTGKQVSTGTCTVNVVKPFYLSDESISLQQADTKTIEAIFFPADTAADVTWSTSDAAVATVNNGVVTAVGLGTATISAKTGDKTETCEVEVTSPMTENATVLNIPVGQEKEAPVTFSDAYANGNAVVWKSSDESIASVGAVGRNGIISGNKVGTATVSVKCGAYESSFEVNVQKMVYNQVKADLEWKEYGAYSYTDKTNAKMPFIVSYYGTEDGYGTLHFQSEDPECGLDFYYDVIKTGKTKRALQGGEGLEIYNDGDPLYNADMLVSNTDAYFEWDCDSITYYDSYMYFMGGTGYSWVYNSNDLSEDNQTKYFGDKTNTTMILLRPYVYYRENSLDDEMISSWRYYSTVFFIDNNALFGDNGNVIPDEFQGGSSSDDEFELGLGEGLGSVVLCPWTVANFNKLGTYSDPQKVVIRRTGEGEYTIIDFLNSGDDISFSLTNPGWENLAITADTEGVKTDATLGGLYVQGGYTIAEDNCYDSQLYTYLSVDGAYIDPYVYGYVSPQGSSSEADSEEMTNIEYIRFYQATANQNYARAYAEPIEFLGNFGDTTPYKYQLRIYANWLENGNWLTDYQGVYVYFNDIDGIYIETGVDAVESEESAKVEYFNLQGVRVANPEHGIFIKRQGNKAVKVVK